MTPTDGLLARTLDTLQGSLSLVVDPSERTYWAFLGGAAITALALHGLRRARGDGSELSVRHWIHGSARLDYKLILVKPFLAALTALPAGLSAWGLAVALVRWLDRVGGGPPEISLPGPAIAVIYTLVLFVLWDLSRYILHRWMHRFQSLWAFHQVHHSAEVLTPFTLYRTHPVESGLYTLRGILVTGVVTGVFFYLFRREAVELQLLGINALGFLFNMVGGNLRHSHVWWSWGERMEKWFISPAQHQQHHARDGRLQRVNYGTALALWDRLGGSLRTTPRARPGDAPEFGILDDERNHDPHGLLSALIDPFVDMASGVGRRLGWGGAALLLWALPAVALAAPPAEPPPAGGDDVDVDLSDLGDAEGEGDVDVDLSDLGAEGEGDVDADLSDLADDATAADTPAPGDTPAEREPVDPDYPEPDADIKTATVSIIGEPEDLPRVVGLAHVVDEETLERAEQNDIHRVLRVVPGVYMRGEDGFGLRPNIGLRGADPNRSAKVTLMEDGVLLGPAPYAAPAAYYFPLVTRMVGVEVFKGPSSVRYGPNTIGGAINMQTRPIPATMKGGLDLGGGMYGYAKAHGFWGTSWKRFGVLIEGVRIQSTGFKELDGGGDTGFGKNELMLKGRVHGDPGARVYQQFDIKLGLATERSNETYLGLTDADFAQTPYRRYAASQRDQMKWFRTQAQASYLVARGDLVDFQATAYRHDFSRSWEKFNGFAGGPPIGDVFRYPNDSLSQLYVAILRGEEDSAAADETVLVGTNNRRYTSQGLATATHVRPKTKHVDQNIEIGARLHHDQVYRNHPEDGFLMTSGVLVPDGEDTVTTARNRATALAGAFHVHDEIKIVKRLTIAPGARVEVIHTSMRDDNVVGPREELRNTNVAFLPGVGLHVQATKWLGIVAGVHRGFSPVAPGQPDEVRPEYSVNYEGGARVGWRGLKAEAIGFFNDYSNLTGTCTFAQGCDDAMIGNQFNAGKVHTAGVESLVGYRHNWARGWFDASATYTYTWSRFRDSFASGNPQWGEVEEGDALPYVPAHVAGLRAAGGMKRFQLHGTFYYVGAMRDVPGQGEILEEERINPNFVLDLGGAVWATERVSIYTLFQNVTASKYMISRRPFGLRPGRPFSFTAGLKIAFG